jgi:hypothetical protein
MPGGHAVNNQSTTQAAWFSESIIDSAVWDADGKSLGKTEHAPMTAEAILKYPHCHLLGPLQVFDGREQYTTDLIIRVAYDGGVEQDVVEHAVNILDGGKIVSVLAWSSDALRDGINAVLRMCGGGRA